MIEVVKLGSVAAIKDFGMAKEAAASEYYRRMSKLKMTSEVRRALEELAEIEDVHRERLASASWKSLQRPLAESEAPDGITAVWEPIADGATLREVGSTAIANESLSAHLYGSLAKLAGEGELRTLLQILMRQEIAHGETLARLFGRMNHKPREAVATSTPRGSALRTGISRH